jgi:hypothetical protein
LLGFSRKDAKTHASLSFAGQARSARRGVVNSHAEAR